MIHKFSFKLRPWSKSNEKAFNRYGFNYKTDKARDFEVAIRHFLDTQWPRKLIATPVMVCYVFYWKNHVRGDLNNCMKSLDDAFNKKVWADDKLIVASAPFVRYSDKERIEVYVQMVEEKEHDLLAMCDFLHEIILMEKRNDLSGVRRRYE